MQVVAFGFDESGEGSVGDHRLTRRAVKGPTISFGSADLVILRARLVLSGNSLEHYNATELLTRSVLADCQRGKQFCLVYDRDEPGDASFVAGRLLQHWGVTTESHAASLAVVYASEFSAYLQQFGIQSFTFMRKQGRTDPLHRLAGPTDSPEKSSAFVVQHGEGLIYVVPGNVVTGSESTLLHALLEGIAAHSPSVLRPTTAPIAERFAFTEERKLREDRKSKQTELETLDANLTTYQARKDILFLRHNPLADRIPEWISEYLGFETRRTEEYKEDFWLLDASGKNAVICEAKGLTQNVKRQHIRQLVLHRDVRELADDFPALLVANTFADAETLQEKGSQRIGTLECSNAVKEHVLVVRSLDLVRLLDQVDRGLISTEDVWNMLITETGWLKVEGTSRRVVKRRGRRGFGPPHLQEASGSIVGSSKNPKVMPSAHSPERLTPCPTSGNS